ncbi:hypothetical protein CR513_26262, partial [Mucuna pruriens]
MNERPHPLWGLVQMLTILSLRLSLNLMRLTFVENVKSSMPKTNNGRKFMKLSQRIHDHVTEMSNMATKLKSMGMEEQRLKKVKDNFIHLMTNDGANTSKRKLAREEFVKRISATSTNRMATSRRSDQKGRNSLKRKYLIITGGLILEQLLMCHILYRDSF